MKLLRVSYIGALKTFLRFKHAGFILVVLAIGLSLYLLTGIDRELMPKVDQREFMIKVDMPTGTKIEVTDRVVKRIEQILFKYPDIRGVSVTIGSSKERDQGGSIETLGSHQSQIVVNLKKLPKKSPDYRKSQDVVQQLQKDLFAVDLEEAELAYILQETIFKAAMGGGKPVSVEIKGRDLENLRAISESLVVGLSNIEGLYDIKSDLMPPQPEVKINVMKQKAALYNLSVNTISLATNAAIRGYVASKYKEQGREYDIRTRLREEDRDDLAKIRSILIHSPLGVEVPLADVAYLAKGLGPSEIKRLDQERTVLVSANIYKRSFNEVASSVEDEIAKQEVSPDYSIQLSGERKEMAASFKSLFFALLLSILLVYMIMAAQFESFWQPFIIIFAVPLAAIGITVALLLTNTTLNIVVFLGVIILGGIVVNNGIILIDHINGLRAEGLSAYDATLEASQNRLRPILMTALTTTLGLMPLALGFSEGAELRAPMAIAVIGGLSSSTLLTLFIVPALYIVAVKMMESGVKVSVKAEMPQKEKRKDKEIEPEEDSSFRAEPGKDITIDKSSEERLQYPDLNDRQQEALSYLNKKGRLTRQEYIQMFDVSVATAARDLKELQRKGIIKPEGPNGPGRWYRMG